ncbi:hypothetical protein COU37_01150 [Candidatus Micrarchaeota archaeon CG10_big_fil_rev_8_21_14_0_10_45_29]|nr:MAG: hypothetical protein COU37_01150 [Candidatus Micrarchaeota archaeon CG10_big_fil_rev_8_21_14_0_10_45_29]
MQLPNIYAGDYKRFMALPIILALLSLSIVFFISPIKMGIDFRGGIDVEMLSDAQPDLQALSSALENGGYRVDSISSEASPSGFVTKLGLARSQTVVDADKIKLEYFELKKEASKLEAEAIVSNDSAAMAKYLQSRVGLDETANKMLSLASFEQNASEYDATYLLTKGVMLAYANITEKEDAARQKLFASAAPADATISFKEITASLSDDFIDRAVMVVVYSVILTSLVVFLIFRSLVPSFAVLSGAAADVIFALGAMAIFGIPLTLASFAALLMLVGFSLDTDILLTMRVMKRREGTAAQRAYESMKTGMSMSASTMVAFLCLFAIALISHIGIYYEISAVVIAGLIGDLIATWAFNAPIILSHMQDMEKKGKIAVERSLLSFIFRS